jgi:hypothetical protein
MRNTHYFSSLSLSHTLTPALHYTKHTVRQRAHAQRDAANHPCWLHICSRRTLRYALVCVCIEYRCMSRYSLTLMHIFFTTPLTTLYYTVLHSTTLHHITPHYTSPQHTTLHSTPLHFTASIRSRSASASRSNKKKRKESCSSTRCVLHVHACSVCSM